MPTLDASSVDVTRLAAREVVLRFLSLAASDPASRRFDKLFDPELCELAAAAARHLALDSATRPAELAPGETAPEELDLRPLIAALAAPRDAILDAHTRVFGLVVSKHCPPYEVQYCPQTFSIHRSQRMADVAEYYRAFGLELGRDVPERADHVACELEFLAWAAAKERHARAQSGVEWDERAAVCRDAQRDFVAEHFAWWVPAFARALGDRARAVEPPAPVPAALADVLAALVPAERAVLGVAPPDDLTQPRNPVSDGCTGCDAAS
jgi:TorA maturation chaperone TorD